MKLAQQEIKATVTVNTSDLGSKKKDEEPPDKDTPARKKGDGSRGPSFPSYTEEYHTGDSQIESQLSEPFVRKN